MDGTGCMPICALIGVWQMSMLEHMLQPSTACYNIAWLDGFGCSS